MEGTSLGNLYFDLGIKDNVTEQVKEIQKALQAALKDAQTIEIGTIKFKSGVLDGVKTDAEAALKGLRAEVSQDSIVTSINKAIQNGAFRGINLRAFISEESITEIKSQLNNIKPDNLEIAFTGKDGAKLHLVPIINDGKPIEVAQGGTVKVTPTIDLEDARKALQAQLSQITGLTVNVTINPNTPSGGTAPRAPKPTTDNGSQLKQKLDTLSTASSQPQSATSSASKNVDALKGEGKAADDLTAKLKALNEQRKAATEKSVDLWEQRNAKDDQLYSLLRSIEKAKSELGHAIRKNKRGVDNDDLIANLKNQIAHDTAEVQKVSKELAALVKASDAAYAQSQRVTAEYTTMYKVVNPTSDVDSSISNVKSSIEQQEKNLRISEKLQKSYTEKLSAGGINDTTKNSLEEKLKKEEEKAKKAKEALARLNQQLSELEAQRTAILSQQPTAQPSQTTETTQKEAAAVDDLTAKLKAAEAELAKLNTEKQQLYTVLSNDNISSADGQKAEQRLAEIAAEEKRYQAIIDGLKKPAVTENTAAKQIAADAAATKEAAQQKVEAAKEVKEAAKIETEAAEQTKAATEKTEKTVRLRRKATQELTAEEKAAKENEAAVKEKEEEREARQMQRLGAKLIEIKGKTLDKMAQMEEQNAAKVIAIQTDLFMKSEKLQWQQANKSSDMSARGGKNTAYEKNVALLEEFQKRLLEISSIEDAMDAKNAFKQLSSNVQAASSDADKLNNAFVKNNEAIDKLATAARQKFETANASGKTALSKPIYDAYSELQQFYTKLQDPKNRTSIEELGREYEKIKLQIIGAESALKATNQQNKELASLVGKVDSLRNTANTKLASLISMKRTAPAGADTSTLDLAIQKVKDFKHRLNEASTTEKLIQMKNEFASLSNIININVANMKNLRTESQSVADAQVGLMNQLNNAKQTYQNQLTKLPTGYDGTALQDAIAQLEAFKQKVSQMANTADVARVKQEFVDLKLQLSDNVAKAEAVNKKNKEANYTQEESLRKIEAALVRVGNAQRKLDNYNGNKQGQYWQAAQRSLNGYAAKLHALKGQNVTSKATIDQVTAEYGKAALAMNRFLDEQRRVDAALNATSRSSKNASKAVNKHADAWIRLSGGLNKSKGLLGLNINLTQQLGSMIGMYFSIYTLKSFIGGIAQIYGEFEKTKIALGSILNDTARANELFNQLKSLAVQSPYQFKDLTSFAKQLSAFSFPVDELYDTTKRLADISAGLGVDMGRVILAVGQVRSAAYLRGQELRQFTEAGIPMLDELAKKFTVLKGRVIDTGQVFDMISKRQVPYEMVKEVIDDLTNEGGKFYKMQEVLAESLAGKISNLTDAYNIMEYEIGKMGAGNFMGGIVNTLKEIMLNWRLIAKAIVAAGAGYAAVKLAQMTYHSNAVKGMQDELALARQKDLNQIREKQWLGQITTYERLRYNAKGKILFAQLQEKLRTKELSAGDLTRLRIHKQITKETYRRGLMMTGMTKQMAAQVFQLSIMQLRLRLIGASIQNAFINFGNALKSMFWGPQAAVFAAISVLSALFVRWQEDKAERNRIIDEARESGSQSIKDAREALRTALTEEGGGIEFDDIVKLKDNDLSTELKGKVLKSIQDLEEAIKKHSPIAAQQIFDIESIDGIIARLEKAKGVVEEIQKMGQYAEDYGTIIAEYKNTDKYFKKAADNRNKFRKTAAKVTEQDLEKYLKTASANTEFSEQIKKLRSSGASNFDVISYIAENQPATYSTYTRLLKPVEAYKEMMKYQAKAEKNWGKISDYALDYANSHNFTDEERKMYLEGFKNQAFTAFTNISRDEKLKQILEDEFQRRAYGVADSDISNSVDEFLKTLSESEQQTMDVHSEEFKQQFAKWLARNKGVTFTSSGKAVTAGTELGTNVESSTDIAQRNLEAILTAENKKVEDAKENVEKAVTEEKTKAEKPQSVLTQAPTSFKSSVDEALDAIENGTVDVVKKASQKNADSAKSEVKKTADEVKSKSEPQSIWGGIPSTFKSNVDEILDTAYERAADAVEKSTKKTKESIQSDIRNVSVDESSKDDYKKALAQRIVSMVRSGDKVLEGLLRKGGLYDQMMDLGRSDIEKYIESTWREYADTEEFFAWVPFSQRITKSVGEQPKAKIKTEIERFIEDTWKDYADREEFFAWIPFAQRIDPSNRKTKTAKEHIQTEIEKYIENSWIPQNNEGMAAKTKSSKERVKTEIENFIEGMWTQYATDLAVGAWIPKDDNLANRVKPAKQRTKTEIDKFIENMWIEYADTEAFNAELPFSQRFSMQFDKQGGGVKAVEKAQEKIASGFSTFIDNVWDTYAKEWNLEYEKIRDKAIFESVKLYNNGNKDILDILKRTDENIYNEVVKRINNDVTHYAEEVWDSYAKNFSTGWDEYAKREVEAKRASDAKETERKQKEIAEKAAEYTSSVWKEVADESKDSSSYAEQETAKQIETKTPEIEQKQREIALHASEFTDSVLETYVQQSFIPSFENIKEKKEDIAEEVKDTITESSESIATSVVESLVGAEQVAEQVATDGLNEYLRLLEERRKKPLLSGWKGDFVGSIPMKNSDLMYDAVNTAESSVDAVDNVRKTYKKAKEELETLEPMMAKMGINIEVTWGDYTTPDGRFDADKFINSLPLLQQTPKVIEMVNQWGINKMAKEQGEKMAEDNGFKMDKDKASNSTADKQLQAWKKQFDTLKKIYSDYKSWSKDLGRDKAISFLQESGIKSEDVGDISLFDPKKMQEYFEKMRTRILKNPMTSEERKAFENTLNEYKIQLQVDVDKESLDNALGKVKNDLEEYARKYNIYKKVFSLTGDKGLAGSISFNNQLFGGEDNYVQDIKDAFDIVARQFGYSYADLERRVKDEDFMKGVPDAIKSRFEEARKYVIEFEKDLDEVFNKVIEDHRTTSQQIAANTAEMEQKLTSIRKQLKEGTITNAMAGQLINAVKSNYGYKNFQLSSDYIKFYSAIYSMSVSRAKEVGEAIKENLDEKLKAGTISAKEYVKEMENIRKQVQALTQKKSNFLTYVTEGLDKLIEQRRELAESKYNAASQNYSDATDKISQLQDLIERANKTGDSASRERYQNELETAKAAQNAASSEMEAAQSSMDAADGMASTVNTIDMIVKSINDAIQGIYSAAQKIAEYQESNGVDTSRGGWGETLAVLGAFSDASKEASSAFDSMKSGNIGGAISGLVGTFTSFGTALNKWHDEKLQQKIEDSQKYIDNLIKSTEYLGKILDRSFGAGESAITRLISSYNLLAKQVKNAGASISDSYMSALTLSSSTGYQDMIQKYEDDINKFTERTKKKTVVGAAVGAVKGVVGSVYGAVIGSLFGGKKVDNTWKIEIDKEAIEALKAIGSGEIKNKLGEAYRAEYAALVAQRAEVETQLRNEEQSKKVDKDAVADYQEKIAELNDQITYFVQDLAEELYSIDFEDWSGQISDALVNAFRNGENAAEAFKETTNDILSTIANKMLQLNIIEPMFEELETLLFGTTDANGNRTGGVATMENLFDAPEKVAKAISDWFNTKGNDMLSEVDAFLEIFNDATGGALTDNTTNKSGLSAGITGITEETADLLASYVNAIRADLSYMRTRATDFYDRTMPDVTATLGAQLASLKLIEANTLRTANNTEGIAGYAEDTYNLLKKATTSGSGVKLNI